MRNGYRWPSLPCACAAAMLIAVAGPSGTASAATSPTPPRHTRPVAISAAALIQYLDGISGKYTLSGQEDGPNSAPNTWQNKVHDITGVYPGDWGGDFAFTQDDIDNRPTVIAQAKREWQNGSLVSLMWHMCPPTVAEPCDWSRDIESHLSDDQWSQVVTDGTQLNQTLKSRLDEIVPFLQDLQDSGVQVLWRPWHEMNDNWAWWGGRPGPDGSLKLYQITHDYLTGKGLHNLVWVWNEKDVGDSSQAAAYYPGDQYVDVVTLDPYMNGFPTTDWYQAMRSIAAPGGKPIALAEVGPLPSPSQLASQPRWTYFSEWIDYLTGSNSDDQIKATYYDSQVLHQGDIHLPG